MRTFDENQSTILSRRVSKRQNTYGDYDFMCLKFLIPRKTDLANVSQLKKSEKNRPANYLDINDGKFHCDRFILLGCKADTYA